LARGVDNLGVARAEHEIGIGARAIYDILLAALGMSEPQAFKA